jgi:colanic acid/amylovoran biosynthesis glycosyltransferase
VPPKKPLRLVYLTASMPFGPEEQFLVAEARELIRQGCEILIVPRSPEGRVFNQDAADLERHSLRRSLLSPSVLMLSALECLRHPGATARVLALLSRSREATVLARNMLVLAKGMWLACVARRWRADHIHAHWGRTTATIALIASEFTGIPWSLTLHRDDIAHPNLLTLKMHEASFTRFISRSGMDIARDVGASGPPDKLCVIHMGVLLPELPSAAGGDRTGLLALCPAHLYPVKGHQYLIEAARILRDRGLACPLCIAGRGHLLGALQHQVATLELEDMVNFSGQVPHERILQWYRDRQVDVVVLPSVDLQAHEHEGIPVALMEAMAYGIPVVSTATGGIPELIGEGAGLMVSPRDPEALADALQRLILDPVLRSQVGLAGRQRIESEYDVERTTADLLARVRIDSDR